VGIPAKVDDQGNPYPCAAEDCPLDRRDFPNGVLLRYTITRTHPVRGSMITHDEPMGFEQYHQECYKRLFPNES